MQINTQLRTNARETLRGNWSMVVVATLFVGLIKILCNIGQLNNIIHWLSTGHTLTGNSTYNALSFLSVLLTIFVFLPILYGYQLAFLKYSRQQTKNILSETFNGFKTYWRALGVPLLMAFCVFLWSLLFFVPGIIMSLAYSMAIYISYDHPELDPSECLEASRYMMKGHKAQLFWMMLGFVGLILLGILTFCIAYLWIIPYMQTCMTKFYEDLKADRETVNAPLEENAQD